MSTHTAEHLFKAKDAAAKLLEDEAKIFHHYIEKLLYLSKRVWPDMQTTVAFLCMRIKASDVDDVKKKLQCALQYLLQTVFLPSISMWDGSKNLYWYIDALFVVHNDMKVHTDTLEHHSQWETDY